MDSPEMHQTEGHLGQTHADTEEPAISTTVTLLLWGDSANCGNATSPDKQTT